MTPFLPGARAKPYAVTLLCPVALVGARLSVFDRTPSNPPSIDDILDFESLEPNILQEVVAELVECSNGVPFCLPFLDPLYYRVEAIDYPNQGLIARDT